jgi:hypothetical protein
VTQKLAEAKAAVELFNTEVHASFGKLSNTLGNLSKGKMTPEATEVNTCPQDGTTYPHVNSKGVEQPKWM